MEEIREKGSEITETRAGMASLVGRANVGKSTLINALVGDKVAITGPKPQTTRYRVRGILNRPEAQCVFVDTPGIYHNEKLLLVKELNRSAAKALHGVDLLLHVVDPSRPVGSEERMMERLLKRVAIPKILVINKIDLPELPYLPTFRGRADAYDELVEVSALKAKNVRALEQVVLEHLPEGPFLYPEHQVTDTSPELWAAELIREKVFMLMGQELPYTAGVEVEETAERSDGTLYIRAVILTDKRRTRGMFIGKGGRKISEIGRAARRELEVATNRKVFLELEVKADPRWVDRVRAAL